MPNRKRKPRISSTQTLARGALAGFVGGVVMTAAERLLLPRLPHHRRPRVPRWDRQVQEIAERMGFELDARSRTILSVTTQVAYATVLGAAYGMAAQTVRPHSRAARNFADAGLTLAASLLAPDVPPPRARSRANWRTAVEGRVAGGLTSPILFEQATAAALSALLR